MAVFAAYDGGMDEHIARLIAQLDLDDAAEPFERVAAIPNNHGSEHGGDEVNDLQLPINSPKTELEEVNGARLAEEAPGQSQTHTLGSADGPSGVGGNQAVEENQHQHECHLAADGPNLHTDNYGGAGGEVADGYYKPLPRRIKKECTSCCDTVLISDMLVAVCGHFHCRTCVREMVKLSIKDETMYPPRCCKKTLFKLPTPEEVFTSADDDSDRAAFVKAIEAISADDKIYNRELRALLNDSLFEAFLLRVAEKEDPNPLYCRAADCNAFIPSYMIRDGVGICTLCVSATCADCKAAWHEGDCVRDGGDELVAKLAAAEGWTKCQSCGVFVELHFGCNHITCRCGAEFCYRCGAPWKTCSCAWTTTAAQLLVPAQQQQQQQQQQQENRHPQIQLHHLLQGLLHLPRPVFYDLPHRPHLPLYDVPPYPNQVHAAPPVAQANPHLNAHQNAAVVGLPEVPLARPLIDGGQDMLVQGHLAARGLRPRTQDNSHAVEGLLEQRATGNATGD